MVKLNSDILLQLKRGSIPGIALFFIFLFFSFFSMFAGQAPVKFERVTRGMPQGIVYCIHQGAEGFLWVGTANGLNRYDGYGVKSFINDPRDVNSLSDNYVHTIFEDTDGNMWIGTNGGLNMYVRDTNSFIHYRNEDGNGDSLSNDEVFPIFQDSRGTLWVGTYGGGLNKMTSKNVFVRYKNLPENPESLSSNRVWAIAEDSFKNLWIGTEEGLDRLDRETGRFDHYRFDPRDSGSICHNYITSIYQDGGGALWVGTRGGLNRLPPEDVKMAGTRGAVLNFTRYTTDDTPTSLSHNHVKHILEDKDGVLWIGTFGGGLNRFHSKENQFTSYRNDSHDFTSLSHDLVHFLYMDNMDILWVATRGGGLNKLKLGKRNFHHYQKDSKRKNSLSDNVVMAICEDRYGQLWVGTLSNGLDKFDAQRRRVEHFSHNPMEDGSLGNNTIRSIYEDSKGRLWVGTDGGMDLYNRMEKVFRHFRHQPDNARSISNNLIRSRIYEDSSGKLWIGTMNGLNRFEPGNERFTRYLHGNGGGGTDPDIVMAIREQVLDGESIMWIGTYKKGLLRLDPETGAHSYYRHDPANVDSPGNNNVRSLLADRSGILWIATNSGLDGFDPRTGVFSHFTEKDGLANNTVFGILEDEAENLWLSTNRGLSKFNRRRREFRNYYVDDGLQSNSFHQGSYHKNRRGEMFFGGPNGFNSFFPAGIKNNSHIPPVTITDFRIANKPVGVAPFKGRQVMKKSISETDEIVLSHDDIIFSFEFAALDFVEPDKNKYAYIMQNFEKEWNYVDAGKRFATYTNLYPGEYFFRIKGTNNDGIWNNAGHTLRIIITPPFWMRWWFRILFMAALCMSAYLFYTSRTRRFREKLTEQSRIQKILKQSRDEMEEARDIAEFRSAENEKLIVAISSIFIAVDAEGKIFQWNDSAEEFFKIPGDRLKGTDFRDLLKDLLPSSELEDIMDKALHRAKTSNGIEVHLHWARENETSLLMANINPIMDKNGKKFGFLFMAEDITNRKKEETQRYLSQKLEALGQMSAGIAHEIRSPLQYIGDNGRFLKDAFDSMLSFCLYLRNWMESSDAREGKLDNMAFKQYLVDADLDFFMEEIPKASAQIVDGVSRVSNIVKSMYEFSYPGRGKSDRSNLNELLKSTLVVAHNRIKKVADLETDYSPDLPLISCGTGQLTQVFLNLLINAADAVRETGKRGRIQVTTKREQSEVVVEISDNGVGIPDEIKEKIFTPFLPPKPSAKVRGRACPSHIGLSSIYIKENSIL
ncbi:MAG: PAS domain-containing protein [bacterium]|nr:PAS domain-containing protein [bacterium]